MVHSDRVNFHAGGKLKRYPRRPRPGTPHTILCEKYAKLNQKRRPHVYSYIYSALETLSVPQFFFYFIKKKHGASCIKISILDTISLLQANRVHGNIRLIEQCQWPELKNSWAELRIKDWNLKSINNCLTFYLNLFTLYVCIYSLQSIKIQSYSFLMYWNYICYAYYIHTEAHQ